MLILKTLQASKEEIRKKRPVKREKGFVQGKRKSSPKKTVRSGHYFMAKRLSLRKRAAEGKKVPHASNKKRAKMSSRKQKNRGAETSKSIA